MKKFSPKFGEVMENCYKKELIKSGYCDTLIGIIKV